MPNPFQLLQVQRIDPGKIPVVLRIEEFGETHGDCKQQEAANQAEGCLRYLEI